MVNALLILLFNLFVESVFSHLSMESNLLLVSKKLSYIGSITANKFLIARFRAATLVMQHLLAMAKMTLSIFMLKSLPPISSIV